MPEDADRVLWRREGGRGAENVVRRGPKSHNEKKRNIMKYNEKKRNRMKWRVMMMSLQLPHSEGL